MTNQGAIRGAIHRHGRVNTMCLLSGEEGLIMCGGEHGTNSAAFFFLFDCDVDFGGVRGPLADEGAGGGGEDGGFWTVGRGRGGLGAQEALVGEQRGGGGDGRDGGRDGEGGGRRGG